MFNKCKLNEKKISILTIFVLKLLSLQTKFIKTEIVRQKASINWLIGGVGIFGLLFVIGLVFLIGKMLAFYNTMTPSPVRQVTYQGTPGTEQQQRDAATQSHKNLYCSWEWQALSERTICMHLPGC